MNRLHGGICRFPVPGKRPWNLPARNPRVPKKASWPSHFDLQPKWRVGAAQAWVPDYLKHGK